MIVFPLLLVLLISLVALGRQYKGQAIENTERAQETVATELLSDVEFMSMRLSQLINANDNMVIRYAVEVDSTSNDRKHEYQKKLGIMQIVDEDGNLIFHSGEGAEKCGGGYTCVRTPVELGNTKWYVESYIKTSELMQDFMRIAVVIVLVVGLFFLGMLTPSFVTEISRFRIINGLHLYNTLAAPIVIMIPTVLTYVFFQKYILAGIAAGAVKE